MERGKKAEGGDHSGERRNRCLCFSHWVLATSALLFLIVGTLYAFTSTFGQFLAYDDEGFLMISVRSYLAGNPLYDQVQISYGPVYYFYELLLHKIAAIPLTNDATAALCVAHWILAATILALAGFRLTRSALLTAFIFMQAIVHLGSLANEPGHPQEVVVVLLAIASLVAVGGLKHRLTLPLLAAIGTSLLFTKINVGGFFGMALALAMLGCTSGGRFVRVGVWGVTLLGCITPILLMQTHFGEAWARYYSWHVSLSILAVGIVANTFVGEQAICLRDWVKAAGASVVVSGMILFILVATGSSLPVIWESLVDGAAKIGGIFYVPLHLENWLWSAWMALLTAVLIFCLKRRKTAMFATLCLIKAIYGITGTWVLVSDPTSQLGALLPWAWLLIVGSKQTDRDLFPRIFLSFLAVWQGLQAYPVAGTQMSVGTLIGVFVFSVCLWDAIQALANTSWLHSTLQKIALLGGGRWAQSGAFLVLLAIFSMEWCEPIAKWQAYEAKQPLDLPGCHYRRLAPFEAIQYRKLAEVLETKSDTFTILPGLNSMYFWTGKRPPTLISVSGEGIMPTELQQAEVVEALKRAKHPLVVVHGKLKDGPLADFVREGCYQVDAVAPFKILAPRRPGKALE